MFNINKCTGASTLQVRCGMVFNTLKGDVVPCYKKYQREICSIQTGCTSELRWGMVWVPDAISTPPPTKLKTRVTAVVMLITPQKTLHLLIVGRIKTRVFFVVHFRQFLSVFRTHKKTQRREVTKFGQAFQISSKTGGGVIRERGLTGMMTVPGRFFSESGHTTHACFVL